MTSFSIQKILVLDDDKIQHLLLRKRFNLISKEIEMTSFEQALEALDFLKSHSVDLVLTDLNLGIMDGWEFVDELEKIKYQGKLYFLTGSIAPEDRRRAERDQRISGFFEKPISEIEIIEILNA